MYAIIETGGKQYKVKEGDVIKVEKLGGVAGEEYAFDKVILLGGEDGVVVGSPYVEGASVAAEIMGDGKEKKVIIYKFKSKKGFHKKKGHRQPFTRLKISAVYPTADHGEEPGQEAGQTDEQIKEVQNPAAPDQSEAIQE